MTRYWITTDTHFNHKKLIEYGRPTDFEEKIDRGLRQLEYGDVLIHLGDICIGKDQEVHEKHILPLKERGIRTILVKGNHDRKSDVWYMEHWWDFVCNSFEINFMGKKLLLSHIPKADNGIYDINFHGHFHDAPPFKHESFLLAVKNEKQRLIALEYTNYQPLLLKHLIYEGDYNAKRPTS